MHISAGLLKLTRVFSETGGHANPEVNPIKRSGIGVDSPRASTLTHNVFSKGKKRSGEV